MDDINISELTGKATDKLITKVKDQATSSLITTVTNQTNNKIVADLVSKAANQVDIQKLEKQLLGPVNDKLKAAVTDAAAQSAFPITSQVNQIFAGVEGKVDEVDEYVDTAVSKVESKVADYQVLAQQAANQAISTASAKAAAIKSRLEEKQDYLIAEISRLRSQISDEVSKLAEEVTDLSKELVSSVTAQLGDLEGLLEPVNSLYKVVSGSLSPDDIGKLGSALAGVVGKIVNKLYTQQADMISAVALGTQKSAALLEKLNALKNKATKVSELANNFQNIQNLAKEKKASLADKAKEVSGKVQAAAVKAKSAKNTVASVTDQI